MLAGEKKNFRSFQKRPPQEAVGYDKIYFSYRLELFLHKNMQKLKILLKYIHYFLTSKSKHSIHGPFIFEFVSKRISKALNGGFGGN